jgi:AcrR family transcriptional regulator
MPRSPEQVEQIKDERRKALLRAARLVFARKGFAGAKIADVAAVAGISHGLVYHYFSEKDSLFNATIEASEEGWEMLVSMTRREPGTPWDRLVFICAQMIAGLREEPEHLLMLVHAYTEDAAPAAAREVLKRFRERILDDLARMIEACQREGQVAAGSPPELARALIAIIQGLALNRLGEPGAALPSLDVVLRIVKIP